MNTKNSRTRPPKNVEEAVQQDVANRLGVPVLRAREILRTVIAVLPSHLPTDVVHLLAGFFPEALEELLDRPDLVEGTMHEMDIPHTGRPAHRNSVVKSSNPHEKTKLSSGPGSANLKGQTLGRGRPTSSNPIHSAYQERRKR